MKLLNALIVFIIVVSVTSFFYFLGLPYYFSITIGWVLALNYSIIKGHFDKNGIEDVIGIWVGVILVFIIWTIWVMFK